MNIVLGLPSHGGACKRHEACLAELRRAEPAWLGIALPSASNIELSRATIAVEAMRRGADVLLWIDADMVFDVAAAREVVSQAHDRNAIVGGLYAEKKFGGRPRANFLSSAPIVCGVGGGLLEVAALGFGLLAHPLGVLKRIAEHFSMPPLRISGPAHRAARWFSSWEPGWSELMGEDYAFCRRARDAGVKVYADTRHRLGHVGEHEFHLEDGSPDMVPKRYQTVELEPTAEPAWPASEEPTR